MSRQASEQKNVSSHSDSAVSRSLLLDTQKTLLQIRHLVDGVGDSAVIEQLAARSLSQIDAVLASQQNDQLSLRLETVSLGAIMQDVLHQLTPTARTHDCSLQFHKRGSSALVTTDPERTRSLYMSLGYSFIEQASRQETPAPVVFALRGNKSQQIGGVFTSMAESFRGHSLRQVAELSRCAKQQFTPFASAGSGVAIAQYLAQSMQLQLQKRHFQRTPGIALGFTPSAQLSLLA